MRCHHNMSAQLCHLKVLFTIILSFAPLLCASCLAAEFCCFSDGPKLNKNLVWAPWGLQNGWHQFPTTLTKVGGWSADIASAYAKVLKFYAEEAEKLMLWCDNCGAQNKNWTLHTALVLIVNSGHYNCKEVQIKYLEKERIFFMSADSFHAQVEKTINHHKNVWTFDDLSQHVETSGKNSKVIPLQPEGCWQWENGLSYSMSIPN